MNERTLIRERSSPPGRAPEDLAAMIDRAAHATKRWLARYSIEILRVSLGPVFLGVGALKLIGVSPAEELSVRTVETLTFGVISGGFALFMIGLIECFIGTTLVTGRLLRTGLLVLAVSMV